MASGEVDQNPNNEPELHLLLTDTFEPLWESLFRGFGEFFFPKKHPPLKLESKPIPVKDLWGFYNYKKKGALGSTVAHVVVLGLIIGVTFVKIPHPVPARFKPQINAKWIDLGDYPLKPAKTQAGGGGGGGDGDVLQASVGRLPKFSMRQITPPAAVIRNPTPKLAVEPTVIVPPDIKLAMNPNMLNLGDPKSSAVILSNGPGASSARDTGGESARGTRQVVAAILSASARE
jgi:protein TonB